MKSKQIRVRTMGNSKRYTGIDSYQKFDTEDFFKDKQLKLIAVLSVKKRLKLLVEIEKDDTQYDNFKDGNKPNNEGVLIEVFLSKDKDVKLNEVLASGEANIVIEYKSSKVHIKNHTKITVYTDTIAVISRDGKKREFYTVRMGD